MNFSRRVGEEGRETALRKRGFAWVDMGAGLGLTVAERSGKSRCSFGRSRAEEGPTGRPAEGMGWAG